MSVRVPVQAHPFERDVRASGRLTRQRYDLFVGFLALLRRVDFPVLVPVEAVVAVRAGSGKSFQCACLKDNADRLRIDVWPQDSAHLGFAFQREQHDIRAVEVPPPRVKVRVTGHRPVTHARTRAECALARLHCLFICRASHNGQRGQ